MKRNLYSFVVLLLLGPLVSSGQIVINEFMATNLCGPANPNQYNDNFGDCSDWVELLNTSAAPVDLSGWFMTENINDLNKWEFPAGSTIPANGFLRIWTSARKTGNTPFNNNHIHSSFRVAQVDPGEVIALVQPDGVTIEDVFYIEVPNQVGYSTGRFPDGSDNWRVFTSPTMNASNTGASYLGYTPTPEFSVAAGYQTGPISLTITCDDPGAVIRYTTDGSFPTAASAIYSGPINLTETTVVYAQAFSADADWLPSYMNWSTYFFGADQHTIPVFSVTGTQLPTLMGGNQIAPITGLEMFDINGQRISKSLGDTNEHGNDSWAYAQRGIDWIDRDKMGYSRATELEIFRDKDRDEFKAYMFKAAANDNYPFSGGGAHIRDAYVHSLSEFGGLDLDERTHESCILYINGEYWGVYEYREKVDDWRYTDYYYGQDDEDIDFIKTWGGTWAEYGSQADWNALRNYIQTNDMTDAANYAYVESQLNVLSLMDYFIINTWSVASDWLNWNTAWWRGNNPDGEARKWRYTLWDMDATFGHYINFTGIPDTSPNADPCFAEVLNDPGGQGHTNIWTALQENEDFYAMYINRYAGLLNTTLSCDFAVAHLDSLIEIIEPEMPRQIARWGGTMAGWQANVQELRDFVLERCGNELTEGMEDCYDLEAITVTILINGDGSVLINNTTITADMTPWTGTYYAGVPITFEGLPGNLVDFINWQILDGNVSLSDDEDPTIEITADGNFTIQANFDPPIPPVAINFNVEPAEAGVIVADGTVISPIPASFLMNVGSDVNIEAVANQWWFFTHWTTANGTVLTADDTEAVNGFTVENPDTFTAHFEPIIRHEVVVRVEPAGAGMVARDGVVLPELPWTALLQEGLTFNFRALPEDFWYFDRWESISHSIPGESEAFDLTLSTPDTLVAYFIQEPFNVYIPNSFTPNNDGRNDIFKPIGTAWQPDTYELVIFNRWGEIVFESKDPNAPWDGSHQNGDHYVKDDIYIYRMKVQSAHDIEPLEYSGSIMVFR